MAKVKIFLKEGESEDQAFEMLQKAIEHHAAGKEHKEAFKDPAARDAFNRMILEHDKMLKNLIKEINEIIDEDV